MHRTSFNEMRVVLAKYLDRTAALQILDVGAALVPASWQHTYRELMAPAWTYCGADLAPAPNVDLVMAGEYRIQEDPGGFDAVLSGQCLEHVRHPWRLVPEIVRQARPGGLVILTAPWQWAEHRYPLDCWRILPDGMRVLLEDAGCEVLEAYTVERDCWGVARRRP